MVQSVSCLQDILSLFPTMWKYDLDLWPPALQNFKHLPLIMVINCIKLYDPGAYGSFSILPTTFSYYGTIRPWPLTSDLENLSSCYQVVWSWSWRFILYPAYNVFLYVIIRPWPLTTNLEKQLSSSSHHVDQLHQVVWSWSLRFILSPAYNVFLLCDNTTLTFDQRPWKRISIFLSSWWSIVPSSMIMELTDHCVSSLQQFPTMWQMTLTFDLGLWNTIGIFLSSFKRFCLQDPDRQKTTLYHNMSL